jgi:xylulokinase
MPILGIDIGTQSLKAVVCDEELNTLGSGTVPYQPVFPRPGWAEQDPRLWVDALAPAIAAALSSARLPARDIRALAVCGQLDGCVPTDADGAALRPAIIWMDRRGDALLQGIDPAVIASRCGLVRDATHMGGKIAWLKANSTVPVHTWHQPVSFIVAALTGARVMSRSLASTTMLYDLAAGDWNDELMALFGASRQELPELAGDADIAGALSSRGAELTGLPAGTPVAVGTGDDFSNLLGCGIGQSGIAGVSLGTSEAIGVITDHVIIDPEMLVETHVFPGGMLHLGNPGWLSGGAVRWAAALLSLTGDDAFMAAAGDAPAGCDGLVFLPALSGALTPKWIGAARGSFVGLTTSHTLAHMARAVLEGTAFGMRDIIERFAQLGAPAQRIRIVGGGARSRLWCRIRADLLGQPVEILDQGEASATGAAVLAAVASGAYRDIRTAGSAVPLNLTALDPDLSQKPLYDQAYQRYRDVFAALEPVWRRPDEPDLRRFGLAAKESGPGPRR